MEAKRKTDGCPACGHKLAYAVGKTYRCAACGAIYGTMYLGDSYGIVKPAWHPEPDKVPHDRIRYFDFTVLGSAGIGRRHGWYDTQTGLIIQVG